MTNLELFVSNFNYIVQATDGEHTMDSEIGEVVFENSSLSSIEVVPPKIFSLQQNYPNPFNPFTTIFYEISGATYVKIIVYDLLGNVVKDLLNNYESEGKKSIVWNGRNNMGQEVSAGVYIYTMIANSNFQTKKMLLVK